MTHEAGLTRRSSCLWLGAGGQLQEYELLRPDADAIAIGERGGFDDRLTTDVHPVARAQVLDERGRALDAQSGVLSRDERIVQGDLTVRAPPNESIPLGQVDLLKEETKAEPGQGRAPSAAAPSAAAPAAAPAAAAPPVAAPSVAATTPATAPRTVTSPGEALVHVAVSHRDAWLEMRSYVDGGDFVRICRTPCDLKLQ